MAYTLITGASSGIGWELAHVFAEKGHDLILVARTDSKLMELKKDLESRYKIKAEVRPCDLSSADGPQELFRQTQGLEVNVLINNAGFGDHGTFAEANWKRQKDMIQVNITSLTELTHLFLPPMIQKNSGKILNVASTAAFLPGPLMAVYYATKAFVLSFSEALYEELRQTGVTVTALCPGPTESGFQKAAHLEKVALFEKVNLPSSREVAVFGYKVLFQGKPVAVHGTMNKLLTSSVRMVPRSLPRRLVKRLQKKR